jgi:hypothetical protein
MNKPKVIVLCGSTKYVQIMAVIGWLLEKEEGAIVLGLHLLPWWYPNIDNIPDHLAEHENCKEKLDELHMRKIDLADEVFVVNQHGYIGNSTTREIEYAYSLGLPFRWYCDHSTIGHTWKRDPLGLAVDRMLEEAFRERDNQ